MELHGAVCVVTGGSEGIGRAIALALGARGARLAICARTSSKVTAAVADLRKEKITAWGASCDVSDDRQVRGFADAVHGELGPVDVLVNNAGLGHLVAVEDMTLAQFDETFAVNMRGVFLMTKAFLPDMRAKQAGTIVNIASLAGRNPVQDLAAYAASKHAVLGFSKSLMLEVRKHNIRVVAICPGTVVTGIFGKSTHEVERAERKLLPEDVAHTVVATIEAAGRAMISELDIRPTNP
jgi:3-oxoacyl-[acyl-carrier protein] reductase